MTIVHGEFEVRTGIMSIWFSFDSQTNNISMTVTSKEDFWIQSMTTNLALPPRPGRYKLHEVSIGKEWCISNHDPMLEMPLDVPFTIYRKALMSLEVHAQQDDALFHLESSGKSLIAGFIEDPVVINSGHHVIRKGRTECDPWLVKPCDRWPAEPAEIKQLPTFEPGTRVRWIPKTSRISDGFGTALAEDVGPMAIVVQWDDGGKSEIKDPLSWLEIASSDREIEDLKTQIQVLCSIGRRFDFGRIEIERNSYAAQAYLISAADKTLDKITARTDVIALRQMRRNILTSCSNDPGFLASSLDYLFDRLSNRT